MWQSALCCGRTAPKVGEEEGSYASRFYRWFLESFKNCLLFLVALPALIDTLASLEVSAMIVYDVATKARDRVISSAQYRWPHLWHYICFVQSGEAFTAEGNKHKHKRTRTHARTHTDTHRVISNIIFIFFHFLSRITQNINSRLGNATLYCLSRPYRFKYFKSSLLQILLGPFLNTLSHI